MTEARPTAATSAGYGEGMSDRNRRSLDSILDAIGWTPLVRVSRVAAGMRTPVFAKCEYMNPGGSLKDRIGLAIVEAAEADGSLPPGGTLVELSLIHI